MIKEKDVIRMKIPFPSISAALALQSHMYICTDEAAPHYGFVKCQTLKPYMLGRAILKHFVDEEPDISRNPFNHTSRIDCDKLFVTSSVYYDDKLKTTSRTDVCQDLYDTVKGELAADGWQTIAVSEDVLASLNPFIKIINGLAD